MNDKASNKGETTMSSDTRDDLMTVVTVVAGASLAIVAWLGGWALLCKGVSLMLVA